MNKKIISVTDDNNHKKGINAKDALTQGGTEDISFREYLAGLGNKLRELRTCKLGCSQDKIGYFMNLSQSEVSRIENGQRKLNILHLLTLKRLDPELDLNALVDDCRALDMILAGEGWGDGK